MNNERVIIVVNFLLIFNDIVTIFLKMVISHEARDIGGMTGKRGNLGGCISV